MFLCASEKTINIFSRASSCIPNILCKSLLLTLQYSILDTAIFNPAEREREREGEKKTRKRERDLFGDTAIFKPWVHVLTVCAW
jgi:hypothetical protein